MIRHLSLRSRLAVLAGLAVAVTVAACAVGCWFIVRARLMDQLDHSLSSGLADGPRQDSAEKVCERGLPDNDRFQDFLPTIQLVWPDGRHCTSPGTAAVAITPTDLTVAQGKRNKAYHDGEATDGTSMRVFTRTDPDGFAISIAKPVAQIDQSLDDLTLLLIVVSAVGVVGAATAGLLIARAGLSPVDRLTGAVEHIARTEDLDTTIPAGGKDEIARLSRSFNSMTRALAGSRDRQNRLIADAGHELRTPLTSLRTNVDLLLRSQTTGKPLPDTVKQTLLANVKAQLVELSDLVTDLLELARPAADHGDDPVVALHDVVIRAVERARPRGPELEIDATIDPWYVRGDAGSLERAVVNLLDNAVKFSPPDGKVTVELCDGELTVVDRGPGILPGDLPYVFDRFWRSPSARGLPGSGLGLAIVARAVRETGGDIRLESGDGGGTVARVRLPGSSAPGQHGGPETGVSESAGLGSEGPGRATS
jgi:two-component system sensor histidine kinase MprB